MLSTVGSRPARGSLKHSAAAPQASTPNARGQRGDTATRDACLTPSARRSGWSPGQPGGLRFLTDARAGQGRAVVASFSQSMGIGTHEYLKPGRAPRCCRQAIAPPARSSPQQWAAARTPGAHVPGMQPAARTPEQRQSVGRHLWGNWKHLAGSSKRDRTKHALVPLHSATTVLTQPVALRWPFAASSTRTMVALQKSETH